MTNKPQFTLKAILGCTTALCVASAMINRCDEFLAVYYVPVVVGGCVGYLVKGWQGLWVGAFLGALVALIIGLPTYVLYLWIKFRVLPGLSWVVAAAPHFFLPHPRVPPFARVAFTGVVACGLA